MWKGYELQFRIMLSYVTVNFKVSSRILKLESYRNSSYSQSFPLILLIDVNIVLLNPYKYTLSYTYNEF